MNINKKSFTSLYSRNLSLFSVGGGRELTGEILHRAVHQPRPLLPLRLQSEGPGWPAHVHPRSYLSRHEVQPLSSPCDPTCSTRRDTHHAPTPKRSATADFGNGGGAAKESPVSAQCSAGGAAGCAAGSRSCSSCCCLLYTSPSPRDATLSRMPSSA